MIDLWYFHKTSIWTIWLNFVTWIILNAWMMGAENALWSLSTGLLKRWHSKFECIHLHWEIYILCSPLFFVCAWPSCSKARRFSSKGNHIAKNKPIFIANNWWNQYMGVLTWWQDFRVSLPTRSIGEDNVALLSRPVDEGYTGVLLPVTHCLAKNGSLTA